MRLYEKLERPALERLAAYFRRKLAEVEQEITKHVP